MTRRTTLEEAGSAVDPMLLLKLRLCVARFGEMDLGAWWNTKGVLSSRGASVYRRGMPSTHFFAQSRVVCAVAAARCREVFSPPGCHTLWNLTPEIEDRIDSLWPEWCRDTETWMPFFEALAGLNGDDLLSSLRELDLVGADTAEAVKGLRRGAEGKSVALPCSGIRDQKTITLLAAAFSRGEKGKLAVPYIISDK